MLSRIVNTGRGAIRRYSTSYGSGGASSAPRPGSYSTTSSLGSSWLAKKRELDAGTWGTRLACLAVIGVSGWALYDQYRNVNNKSEMLDSLEALERSAFGAKAFMHDPQQFSRAIGAGFENLPDLICLRRRSFSGDVIMPVSAQILSNYEARLVKALVNASQDEYENRWRALTMLHTLARTSPSVRERLRDKNTLFHLMELGTFFSVGSSPRHEWLVAADLLTLLLQGEEGANARTDSQDIMKKFLSKYAESKNPVAMIVHARFAEDWDLPGPTTTFSRDIETNMISQALSESWAVDYANNNVSGASVFSALGFAVFGGIWGRVRWGFRLARHAALTSHAWAWSSRKHIARPLALWFMLDMLGTRLLTFASNDKFEFDQKTLKELSDMEARANVTGMTLTNSLMQMSQFFSKIPGTSDMSLASFLSVAQNLSFTAFSIWMISTRRYAFLPLAAAGIYNHYDEVKKIPQVEYVTTMGKMQANEVREYIVGDGKRVLR